MSTSQQDTPLEALRQAHDYLMRRGEATLAKGVSSAMESLLPTDRPSSADLLTTGEAARLLSVRSINTIKRWAREGLLEAYQVGGRVKVTRQSVQRILESPVIERQQAFERDLGAALEPFDAGDDPVPPARDAHIGRKPWESPARAES